MSRYSGKDDAAGDLAHWLEMHNAGTLIYDRKTGDHQEVVVPLAAVSVAGGFQPNLFRRVMTPAHFDCGLVAPG
jgi:hypothetical protein